MAEPPAKRPSKKQIFEQLVTELAQLTKGKAAIEGDAQLDIIRRAFASRSSYLVARAARLVGEQRLAGFEASLVAAYGRGFDNVAKNDPGCHVKTAAAEALDFLDHGDVAPFLRGLDYVQHEGGSPPNDAAIGLRSRCALAIVRLREPRALILLADRLADPESHVRQVAAEALAYHGDEKGAALLRLKLRLGDTEPDVVTDVLKAYLQLDFEDGLKIAADLLAGKRTTDRHGAVLALGECRNERALPLLRRFLESAILERDVRVSIFAIATLRFDEARDYLLSIVASRDELRAPWALQALEPYTADPAFADELRRVSRLA